MFEFITAGDALLDPIPAEKRAPLAAAAQARLMTVLHAATFTVDDTGTPASETVRERLRQAAAAQVLAWHRWGIDPNDAGPDKGRVKATAQLGPASVSYDFRDNYAAARARARDDIDPGALAWLRPLLTQPAY